MTLSALYVLFGFVVPSQATSIDDLESVLAAGGLQDCKITSTAMRSLGLSAVMDVALLNAAEQAELEASLKHAGISLGERSRLRQLAHTYPREYASRAIDPRVPIDTIPAAVTYGSLRQLQDHFRGLIPPLHVSDEAPHRVRLQDSTTEPGRLSIEVVAIAFTGLIGLAGYLVQARSTQKALEVQADLEREAAQREKVAVRAGKQLDRVLAQGAEFISPIQFRLGTFFRAFERAAFDCNLEDIMTTYAMQWVSPPTQPHLVVKNLGNPKFWKGIATNPFYGTLSPEDLAHMAADPIKRARWTNLVLNTMLPPLREVGPILSTKVRHIRKKRYMYLPSVHSRWRGA
jgi:hypothetical protein